MTFEKYHIQLQFPFGSEVAKIIEYAWTLAKKINAHRLLRFWKLSLGRSLHHRWKHSTTYWRRYWKGIIVILSRFRFFFDVFYARENNAICPQNTSTTLNRSLHFKIPNDQSVISPHKIDTVYQDERWREQKSSIRYCLDVLWILRTNLK